MGTSKLITLLTCVFASIHPSTISALSIPLANDLVRKGKVSTTSNLIKNVERQILIKGTYYPRSPGPTMENSTLYRAMLNTQIATLSTWGNNNVSAVATMLQSLGPYNSLKSFEAGYDALQRAGFIDRPFALDNSDENFGAMRLGIRGYNIKLVVSNEWSDLLECLSGSLVREQCNENTIEAAISSHKVFVQDFSTVGQYTDLNATQLKYAPNVVGFFCNNMSTGVLLPLAIKLVDSDLLYTKEDSAGEWQLAKMALDASELNFQQSLHFVQTHLVSVPIQVEMMRSMAEEHPIYALLNYHFFCNMGIEHLSAVILLSDRSPYDQSMAFGATGFARSVYAEYTKASLADDFPTEILNKGLEHLPNNRYVRYGATYYSIIKTFVTAYVKAYYVSEDAIQSDLELQTWAARATIVQGVNDFPSAFKGYDDLINLVANLVFKSMVKHHYMNGRTSWNSHAAPFSAPALYNAPLPTKKGIHVNPFDYVIPSDLFPVMSYLFLQFYRPIPVAESALGAYTMPPFSNDTFLEEPIAQFRQAMLSLENTMDSAEPKGNYLDTFAKPSVMPWFTYI